MMHRIAPHLTVHVFYHVKGLNATMLDIQNIDAACMSSSLEILEILCTNDNNGVYMYRIR